MKQTFYMVYVDQQLSPTHRHATYNLALEEAKRLSEKTGYAAWVLEAVTKIQKIHFQIEELVDRTPDTLPF